MERYTWREEDGDAYTNYIRPAVVERLAKYEDLEEQCIAENQCGIRELLLKWKEFFGDIAELYDYRKAEEQGLLLRLPCKVGDGVYILAGSFGTFYEKDICDGFYMGNNGILQVKVKNHKGNHGTYGIMGKTVFLTREEAEAALAEKGGVE